jgi:hypothetical protein
VKAPEVLAQLEIDIGLTGKPQRLRNAIENVLASSFPKIQAAEKAEKLESAVSKLIIASQSDAEERGTVATLSLIGSASDMVAGYCHVLSSDTPVIVLAKAHRLNISPLLDRMRNLHYTEFECFGARVLCELGAGKTRVTRHSNDQGIDFFGVLSLGQYQQAPAPFFRLAHDVELRFVGQAKHYPTTAVGTSVVRELVGALSLARFKAHSTDEDLFAELALKGFSPVVAFLFTTGTLSSGAIELASKAGIVARDGEQLAVFLADRGVGMTNGQFDPAKFDAWLNT